MKSTNKESLTAPAILFDVDGTLIDSVYEHVSAWSEALRSAGIVLPKWRIHRRIGMSGKSFLRELLRPMGRNPLPSSQVRILEQKHDAEFSKVISRPQPLPGAKELLKHLSAVRVKWAIATTGNSAQTKRLLKLLKIPKNIPVITGDDVAKTKPAPDAFVLAAGRLGVSIRDSIVVGDSTWDLLAAVRKRSWSRDALRGFESRRTGTRRGLSRVCRSR